MSLAEFQSQLNALFAEGVRVEALLRFYEDVLRFNRGRNLVSRRGGDELVQRLILESASAAWVLPLQAEDTVLDLGSGAGFPGIPFAIARPVPCRLVLLDRRPVACDFLRRERVELDLEGVEVLEGQSQELLARDPELVGGFHWVLMKAVAPPVDALRMARSFVAVGGRVALFRRRDQAPDAAISSANWEWEGFRPLSGGSSDEDEPALQLFRRLT